MVIGGACKDRWTRGRYADRRRDLVVIYHMIATPGNFRAPSAELYIRAGLVVQPLQLCQARAGTG